MILGFSLEHEVGYLILFSIVGLYLKLRLSMLMLTMEYDVDKFKDGVEIVSLGARDKKEHNYGKKLSNGA